MHIYAFHRLLNRNVFNKGPIIMFSIGHKVPFQIHLRYLDVKNSVQKRTKRIRIPCRKLIKTLTCCTGEKKNQTKKSL